MKKIYQRKKEKFLEWVASKFPKLIVELYARLRTQEKKDFVISATEIDTKKGRHKRTLFFVETKLGKYKFWTVNGQINMDVHPAFIKYTEPEKQTKNEIIQEENQQAKN